MPRSIVSNATYLDVHSGKYIENQTIVMKDRKFSWIGDNGDYEKEEGDKAVDAEGKFVLPGMVDTHVHLMGSAIPGKFFEKLVTTSTDRYGFVMLTNAQKFLASGFTTVRDVGCWIEGLRGLKHVTRKLEYAGPRVLGASSMLTQPGTQESEMPDYLHASFVARNPVTSGPVGMIEAVRERIAKGADWIKIEGTGGVLHGEHSNLESSYFTDEELEAIVKETHRSGRYVASHAHSDGGIRRATEKGVDTIEHGSFVSEETAKLMIQKGNYLIPTIIAGQMIIKPEVLGTESAATQERVKQVMSRVGSHHKLAFDMGVNMALGTDAGTPGNYPGTSAREMQFYTDLLGASNLKAIQMATIDAAKALKSESSFGSIEVGKAGDLVIMEKNPLEDIKVIQDYQNQTHVFRDGVLMAEKGRIVFTLDINP